MDIKIRVWDSISKVLHPWDKIKSIPLEDFIKLEHYTLELWTGKKDSEGTEVYDGDILDFDKDEWGGNDHIHVVSWDDYNAEWSWGGGITSDMGWRKVIGNIHQDKHLLDGGL